MDKWILGSVVGAVVFCPFIVSFVRASNADEPPAPTVVVLETNQGNIELELWPAVAPRTCENMTGLVKKGYYDGTVFHRVIKGFMLQEGAGRVFGAASLRMRSQKL